MKSMRSYVEQRATSGASAEDIARDLGISARAVERFASQSGISLAQRPNGVGRKREPRATPQGELFEQP